MLRGLVLSLAVGVHVAMGAVAKESPVKVASSRDLQVAVVDATKASPTRDAMHQAFAMSLGASLSQQCGGPIGVRAKCVGADNASFNLGTGVYDAVLVVGRGVPDSLRKTDAITLSAIPEGGKRDRMLYLLVGNGDSSLQSLLAAAFAGAMNDEKFLETFTGIARKLPAVTTGDKVATAQ